MTASAARQGRVKKSTVGDDYIGFRIRYTRDEAAEVLSISLRKLDYLRAARKIVGRVDGKNVFFDHDELLSYAKSNPPEGTT